MNSPYFIVLLVFAVHNAVAVPVLSNTVNTSQAIPSDDGLPRWWFNYHSHDEINSFLNIAAVHAGNFASVTSIGKSQEGREMKVLSLAKAGPGAPNVWIEGGIHAREWIAPAVAQYLIWELIHNHQVHSKYLDKVNFHILPVANPDGYEFSRSSDRMWRKSRTRTPISKKKKNCLGVDLNRNFGYHWKDNSNKRMWDPCGDEFAGVSAFSEPESKNIARFVLSRKPMLTMALHSAAGLLLYPYSYGDEPSADKVKETIALCQDATKAMNAVHGMDFECKKASDIFKVSGTSMDWYTGVAGARFSFTIELRGKSLSTDANWFKRFELPPKFIVDSGEETWAAFRVMLDKVIEVAFPSNSSSNNNNNINNNNNAINGQRWKMQWDDVILQVMK